MKRNCTFIGAAASLLAATLLSSGSAEAACNLGPNIKHVVHLTFDNVHLRRDNPNVPSDLELMPNLLNFMLNNGTVSGNHFTPLISHTADDILTALTGVYPDRHGQPVSNSYRVFDANGHPSSNHTSFIYWTAKDATDGLPVMLNENGKNAPAPWVPFTRAGCDVGAYSVANMEFETLPTDVNLVFGAMSPEGIEANNPAQRDKANADFLGIAIHCGVNSPLCNNSHAKDDALPDEPGGYAGFKALFGNFHVQPVISPGGAITDLDGNVIQTAAGNPGFPNIFSPTASQSLGYTATMLEAGVQVVYLYIADAHDNRGLAVSGADPAAFPTFGPGEAGYVRQLQAYDKAWGQFFARLAAHGIDKSNTLFIFTADENDHFVGGAPTPANCNGVTTPCTYVYPNTNQRSVGELMSNLDSLLKTQRNNTTPFLVHSDDAPTIYIDGNPGPTDPVTRKFQQDVAALTFVNPLPGKNNQTDLLTQFMADQAEMKLLHMVTKSPARTPTFTMFGNPDYFFQTTRGSLPLAPVDCSANVTLCVSQGINFAWNHGDVQQDITRAWFGMVGPGVKPQGRNDRTFSDHTDLRPTMLTLTGLKDDYVHDGRALIEKLERNALPQSLRDRDGEGDNGLFELMRVYKQLNAPLGSVGTNSLAFATRSINSTDANTYSGYLDKIAGITADRDTLAAEIKNALDAATFNNQPLRDQAAGQLIHRAKELIDRVEDLAKPDHKH
jgi:hypothetical protein